MKKMILFLAMWAGSISMASAQAFSRQNQDNYRIAETRIVNLFPNPAINNATVVLNYAPAQKVFVDVVDFNGEIRRSFAFLPGGRQLTFDVGFLDRGYYVIRVREASRLVDIVKLIKA